jgi:predicted nucleotidyltransferase
MAPETAQPSGTPSRARPVRSHYPENQRPTEDEVIGALRDLVAALDTADISYVLMGGVGAVTVARPRITDDLDIFVAPDDAQRVLDVLEAAGFATEVSDPTWLYKGFKYGVLVDVIFRSAGDVYLDREMLERAEVREFKGVPVPVIAPEDLLVIKAVAAREDSPHHWYDALAIVARGRLDWEYLANRALTSGPRRVLSLLLYAESNDLAVPATVIRALVDEIYPPS